MKKILFLFALLFLFYSANTGYALTLECMFCHSEPQGLGGKFPAINDSLFGFHININSSDGTGNLTSSDCITCHYNASVSSFHVLPVATYTCEDCHIRGAVPGAPRVNNHIKNSSVSVNAFCSDCHNKTTTLFMFDKNASAAHYGINASFGIAPGNSYCAFCHSNSTTIYKDVMQNQNNSQLKKHTTGFMYPFHPAGQPDCTTCHGIDTNLHGSEIFKPVLNSDFCLNCHRNDRLQKNRHNNKVECLSCHTSVPSDIHNIKYIMQNGSYSSINATICYDCHNFTLPPPSIQLPLSTADCTTCHQNGGLARFNLAPQIPTPLKHSTNPNSGNIWNGSQPAYWNNTSPKTACKYCHGNTVHSSNPLGNITNIQSGNIVNQIITNTSYWCANCHYMNTSSGNYFYNGSSYSPVPPEIQNKTGLVPQIGGDGTSFFNHSFDSWSDNVCKQCHSTNFPNSTTQFIHNVTSGGGGPNCISCHDTTIGNGAPLNKRVDISEFNKSIHNGINGGGNRACWACHGDGTEPTGGHPPQYKSPRKCGDDNCHSLSQSYRAPMIYSHFRNASLNDNNKNAVNFNVTVQVNCEDCHIQSVIKKGNTIKSTVSHYGILTSLPDTRNCIYCHVNRDNSEKWGNATRININRTSLVELDRISNKFTVKAGESVALGTIFKLKVDEISTDRIALIELLKNNVLVDRSAVSLGNYTYEETLTIDNGSSKVPVIVLNFTGFVYSGNISFVQFEGFRTKRVHSENQSGLCYQCHYYSRPQIKYKVIERVDNKINDIYYTEELVNFSDNKQYDETDALRTIMNLTDTDFNIDINRVTRKSLFEGEAWNIAPDYTIKLNAITKESDDAFIQLNIENYSYDDTVRKGEYFEYKPQVNYLGYQPGNITIFRAKVADIVHGKSNNLVVLENVTALSMDIKKIEANQTQDGYNASWLWENSTITVGKIPYDFHSPSLFDGKDGGGDCLSCHGANGVSVKKVAKLGKHSVINGGGNRACYACHGGSVGIQNHPPGFKSPRQCISCHASTVDNYSAIYIGGEEHKNGVCENCHVTNIHTIQGFDVRPSVENISVITQGDKTIIKALALAGYKIKVMGGRYYIDSPEETFMMYPEDGIFDSQKEEIVAQINVSKISPGKHIIYVEAMQLNDQWGGASSIAITIEGGKINPEANTTPGFGILFGAMAILFVSLRKRFRKKVNFP
ncbi:MAG: hypothetical protein O8C61_02595 [Candidatus Methanoperedens sp.]|nr:hypothetical protein [Candidatus Methanoperedens sp.]